MRTRIDCCKGCVAPKRHENCHAFCPEYTGQRAELDETNAVKAKRSVTNCDILQQKYDGVARATRKRRL